MRIVVNLVKILVAVAALAAMLHLICWDSKRPVVRLVQVTGDSMEPTLRAGDRLLFIRWPWRVGSIVLADVDEDAPVVKRVGEFRQGWVYLCGDNKLASTTYWARPEQIECVLLCQAPLPVPSVAAAAPDPIE